MALGSQCQFFKASVNMYMYTRPYEQEEVIPMDELRNHKKQLVGMGDPQTGLVEQSYKHQLTRTYLPIGGEMTVVRNNVKTTIKRLNKYRFKVDSIDL